MTLADELQRGPRVKKRPSPREYIEQRIAEIRAAKQKHRRTK